MAVKFLDKTGLGYFCGKIKVWCNSTFAAIAHTHTSYAVKHSYTTAANAAKNWYRIANANTQQLDTSKPIRAQFIVTAYNASYDAGYYETWFVNAIVFGRQAHIIIFGGSSAPFSQARILYENTTADIDANDRPAIDLYLNYQLANGTTKVEIEEIYNSGWTFVVDGQLAASTVPSGFESVASTIRNNGVDRSTTADYASYLNRQISNITAAFTLADSYLYRSRTLNCTGTFTITIPSINSGYMWCVIKNKNTSSGVITLHPSTTSVLIDGSNADITLRPMEYVCIHSAGANNYSLIADGRWKSQKANKATTLAGYGITDAKIANGTITLGSSSITPLTSHQDISGKVDKTGDTMTGDLRVPSLFFDYNLFKKHLDVVKGTNPSEIKFWSLYNCDKNGIDYANNMLGVVETTLLASGIVSTYMRAIKNQAGSQANGTLGVAYDTANNYAYTFAPTPTAVTDNTNKIATTEWVNTARTFIKNSNMVRSIVPSEDVYTSFRFTDANNVNTAAIYYDYHTDRSCYFRLLIHKGTTTDYSETSELGVGYDANGNGFTYCPTPDLASNDNNVANAYWVRHATGNTSLNARGSFGLTMLADLGSDYQMNVSDFSSKPVCVWHVDSFADNTASAPSSNVGDFTLTRLYTGLTNYACILCTSPRTNRVFYGHFWEGTWSGWNTLHTETVNLQFEGNANTVMLSRDNDSLFLCGGTNNQSNAFIGLAGGTNSSTSGVAPGGFYIHAKTNNTDDKVLAGTPGGTLTWWGQNIQTTSDQRLKTKLESVPDDVLDAWEDVEWGQFQYLEAVASKGGTARLHSGLVSQQVQKAFSGRGLDACDYGLICHETRDAVDEDVVVEMRPAYTDEEGVFHPEEKTTEHRHEDAVDLWMIRYAEALCMEAAYQRRKNKILERRISELETQVENMLQVLESLKGA